MADYETEGIEDLIHLTKSGNNSEMDAGETCQSSAVLAFLQLEREKVIAKLRRIEELLGRKRIRSETIDIPAEISQPLFTEEGFGLRKVPDFPTLKPRPRPPLKGLLIPSVKKPYFGLKSKWTKQTIHEACKQELPKLRTPPGGHLCQPMCDGCLHSYIVLYLGLEADKQHGDDPDWKPSGYPSVWNGDLSEKLRHSMPHRRSISCNLQNAPTTGAKVMKKATNKPQGKLHSIHEVSVPKKAMRKPPAKRDPKGPFRTAVQQPLVVDAPDLSILNASMSNVNERSAKVKIDPIEVVGRINHLTARHSSEPIEHQQMNIANCVVKSMSIDSAVFSSAHFQDIPLKEKDGEADSEYLDRNSVERSHDNCQKRPSYALHTPEEFANPCRAMEHFPIYKEHPQNSQNDLYQRTSEQKKHLMSNESDQKSAIDIRRQRWSSCRRPPFHMGVEEGGETARDVSNNSFNFKQQEMSKPIIVPRNAHAELSAEVESFKGDDDLEIDLRIIIDNEENVSLEVENVRYRSSEGSARNRKESRRIQRKTDRQVEPDSSERTSAFESEE